MQWWIWILVGLGLLAFEVVTPGGLVALFFGLGAVATGALVALGLAGPPWAQWLIFAVLSIAAVAALRGRVRSRLAPRRGPDIDALVGETAIPSADLEPQAVGRAELRGSTWEARNVGDTVLAAGQRCRVARVDGLMIELRPEP